MEKTLLRIAHKFFGISLIAFGIQQFMAGQLVAGRPPAWPSFMPGELFIVYLVGAWLIFDGISIVINRKISSFIPTALFILVYCALRNLYVVLWDSDIGASLTNFGKGITLGAGLLFINATLADDSHQQMHNPMDNFFMLCCYYCLGIFLLASGVQHFIFVEFVKFLVPAWIPFPVFWAYLAGIALAISGLSLITGIKRQLISQWSAIMIFCWVIVLHIPRALQDLNNQNEWTAVFEALAFSSLLFMVSKTSVSPSHLSLHTTGAFVRTK